jgi:hypothetical protein
LKGHCLISLWECDEGRRIAGVGPLAGDVCCVICTSYHPSLNSSHLSGRGLSLPHNRCCRNSRPSSVTPTHSPVAPFHRPILRQNRSPRRGGW